MLGLRAASPLSESRCEKASYWMTRRDWWSQVMQPQPLLYSPCSCRQNHWSPNPDAVSPTLWTSKALGSASERAEISPVVPLRRSRSCPSIPRGLLPPFPPGDPRPLPQGQRMRKGRWEDRHTQIVTTCTPRGRSERF